MWRIHKNSLAYNEIIFFLKRASLIYCVQYAIIMNLLSMCFLFFSSSHLVWFGIFAYFVNVHQMTRFEVWFFYLWLMCIVQLELQENGSLLMLPLLYGIYVKWQTSLFSKENVIILITQSKWCIRQWKNLFKSEKNQKLSLYVC